MRIVDPILLTKEKHYSCKHIWNKMLLNLIRPRKNNLKQISHVICMPNQFQANTKIWEAWVLF
jgi:hypothetical protein